MIRVTAVQPDSIAAELGLSEGTELLSVNGRQLDDFLDWEFLTAEEQFLLLRRELQLVGAGEVRLAEVCPVEGCPLSHMCPRALNRSNQYRQFADTPFSRVDDGVGHRGHRVESGGLAGVGCCITTRCLRL
jgi:hypothetical protein